MWGLLIGRTIGLWHILDPGIKGFVLGTVVGLTVLSLSCGIWPTTSRSTRIAAENAQAALDTTRAISAKHDTVYARILAQKDVQLAGALKAVASKQHDKPRAVVTVTTRGRGVDTSATHCLSYPFAGGCPSKVSGTPAGTTGNQGGTGHGAISDSLLLQGPPVAGVVSATLTDSTWYWRARLRPSPVDLTLALTCGPNGPEVLAQGPSWVSTSIGTGQVDPRICHPAPSKWFAGFKQGVVVTGVVYIGFRVVKSLLQKR